MTIKDLQRLEAEGKIRGFSATTQNCAIAKSKYGAVKTEIDGIVFDSAKEAARYVELRYLERQKLISGLKMQVPYELNEGGTHSLKYLADFVYTDDKGCEIVEDVKGYRTKEYKKKKRLMMQIYNITIIEK